jgi:hypothetical protein
VAASIEPAAAAAVADTNGLMRGSAFRISNNLLLTALHVLLDNESPRIRLFGVENFIECTTAWTGDIDDLDIAILRIDSAGGHVLPDVEPVSIGQFVGMGRRDCDVTGYSRGWGDHRVPMARRLTGTIDPGAYPGANFLVLELPRTVEPIGFSGSGVRSEGKLIGIVTTYNPKENSILLIPATRLLEDAGFRAVIKSELKREPEVVQLLPPETSITSAIKSVSKADPKNIQEVAAASFDLSDSYYANVLSQAKRSFNAAVVAGIVGSLFFLAAIIFALASKQLSASLISSVGGAIVEVVSGLNFWLYSRTAVQLNSFHIRLERMQRYLVANSVAASLEGEHRESTLEKLVMIISEGESRRES